MNNSYPTIQELFVDVNHTRQTLLDTELFDSHDTREFTLYLRGTNFMLDFSLGRLNTHTIVWRNIYSGCYIPFEKVLESLDKDTKRKLCFHLDLLLKK